MSPSFNFPRPTTKADDLEDLYKAYGVDRTVVLDFPGTYETPETVREGYYGAYLFFFHSCGLIFPIPDPILEILAELGLSLTQILPKFLRYLIAFLVRAREEGLSFGLSEFRQLVLVKRNQQNPGTFLVSPRPDVLGERRTPVSLSPGSEDETIAATRKRRRSSEGALPGSSRPRFVPEGDGSLFAAQSDLISLAGRMRYEGCRLPSLASSAEKEAYAKVMVASSKVMEAFNEYVVVMEDHVVASRNDKEIESIGSKIKRLSKELEATKREGKKDAEKIEALTEDWRRIHLENEALMTQMCVVLILSFACQRNMASRRSNPRDSDRVRTQTGFNPKDLEDEKSVARVKSSSPTGSEGRDRPPKKAKTNGSDYRLGVLGEAGVAKPFHWQFSHSKDCPITEDPDSVAHLVRHFKPAGCPLPSLRNMTEREAYVKMVAAHAMVVLFDTRSLLNLWFVLANNEFAATLEKRLQDVPRFDELYEIKKVVRELKLGLKKAQDRERANTVQLAAAEKLGNQATSLEARLRVVSNERKSALEQVSFLEAKIESFANKFSDDLRRATYDSKKALADSYLNVLVSLKESGRRRRS
ncbi:hypothetical protein F2Q70_00030437 [Brassica cretica]|uniref:Uncharacterized protein n=1 Tax=Brassica cretica TaxID=69181 RepID=A0A8S9FHM3_BRACR|nr:hypothetical protein F2Q70_00030437 [Brassica cretica]